ncbi:MAG: hypothetical protein ACXIVE_14950, partial [Salinarimonas sp.]
MREQQPGRARANDSHLHALAMRLLRHPALPSPLVARIFCQPFIVFLVCWPSSIRRTGFTVNHGRRLRSCSIRRRLASIDAAIRAAYL